MAKHHPDLVMCRKQPGIAIGRLCEKCDGKCVICDSFVNPKDIVHICDECNYGSFEGRCVVCGGVGVTDAYYCSKYIYIIYDCFLCRVGMLFYYFPSYIQTNQNKYTPPYNTGECVQTGKDRDGCPKVVNLGSTKTDLFYERKKYGFKKR